MEEWRAWGSDRGGYGLVITIVAIVLDFAPVFYKTHQEAQPSVDVTAIYLPRAGRRSFKLVVLLLFCSVQFSSGKGGSNGS
jgi:hypothetical protein